MVLAENLVETLRPEPSIKRLVAAFGWFGVVGHVGSLRPACLGR
jgi:hypothetical protein